MTTVDAHQHFWQPLRGDYGWMPEDDPILSRAYAPVDLAPELAACGIDKTVLVQAAPTVNETEYLLGIADASDFVAGVVGWIDFETPRDQAVFKRLANHPKFKGVRPMIQDLPDDDWMLRGDVQWAFQVVSDLGLTFDALGFPRHLSNFLTILKRYPDMRAVVDHCMKPQIGDHSPESFQFWADGMTRIAAETQSFCKLSGIVTEAKTGCTQDDLRPYVDHVLEVFGPRRIMWGSDWPVSRLRGEYGDWHGAARDLTSALSANDQAQIFGGSAERFYEL